VSQMVTMMISIWKELREASSKKMSPFVFHGKNNSIWVWNNMRVSK